MIAFNHLSCSDLWRKALQDCGCL